MGRVRKLNPDQDPLWLPSQERIDASRLHDSLVFLSKLKSVLSTGSPLSHESFDYVYRDIKADVCLSSISGGTDSVSCFALANPTLPVYRGELQSIGTAEIYRQVEKIAEVLESIAVGQVIHGELVKNKDAFANPEALDCFVNRAELSA